MGEHHTYPFTSRCDEQPQTSESRYSPRATNSLQTTSSPFLPSRSQCDLQNMMLPTTMAPDQPYMLQPGRSPHSYDYAPHSAVSSFNAPAHCDATLLTPVSMAGSPHLSSRSGSLNPGDRFCKSSPTMHQWLPDDDFRYNQPMKYKDPTSALQIHTDSGFPSVYHSPEPYFGHLGVSTSSNAGRVMALSPNSYHNTNMSSAGGYSSHSQNSTPPLSASSTDSWRSYDMMRSNDMSSALYAAPKPLPMPHTSQKVKIERRQTSVHSTDSTSSSVSTQKPKKRKSPGKSDSGIKKKKEELVPFYALAYPDDLTPEDMFLLSKARYKTEWKKIVEQIEIRTGNSITVPCAQMRKKRLVDRIREFNKPKGSDHLGSEHGSNHDSGPEGELWDERWDSMRASPTDTKHGIKMEIDSPEARSPANWHEPRSSYNTYPRNLSYPSLAPILPAIQSTTTMDRVCNNIGSDTLQYFQRHQQQMEDRTRQAAELDQHHSQHQILKTEHETRDPQRRW